MENISEETRVMLTAKLRRCSCGGYGQYDATWHCLHENNKVWIYCDNCGKRTDEFDTNLEAVTAWNKRQVK